MENLKNNVKNIRLEKGYTQEELARKIDISWRTLQKIEAGANTTIYVALKLKKALKCKLEDLFYLE